LVDRQQGGRENLEKNGISLHAVLTMEKVAGVLLERNLISNEVFESVRRFQKENMVVLESKSDIAPQPPIEQRVRYRDRVSIVRNPIGKRLLEIMERKRTNLCFSADLTDKVELLRIVESVGPFICILKTHIDVIEGVDPEFLSELKTLAERHGFLIFEDRKFADIGNTVSLQFSKGVFRITDWADIVNAHGLPGPGIIDGLEAAVGDNNDKGLLLIAELSSAGCLIDDNYVKNVWNLALTHNNFVFGFICQDAVLRGFNSTKDPQFLYLTPGVQMIAGDGSLGQQYKTPQQAFVDGCDIIIVGRGIYKADNPASVAEEYRRIAWQAYENTITF